MIDADTLYSFVGRKIREARQRTSGNLSQQKLADRLGVSRASIVNIEAGRQHAPLYLLWQIADALNTDLPLLLPRRDELLQTNSHIQLNSKIIEQIALVTEGNPETERQIAGLVRKLQVSIEANSITKDKS